MGFATFDLTELLRPAKRGLARVAPRPFTYALRAFYDLRLLLGGRLILFVGLDLLLVTEALMSVVESGARLAAVYSAMVITPALVIGVPALASLVGVERASGSLDLALSTEDTVRYFVRRAGAVVVPLTLQGTLLLVLAYFENASGVGGPIVQLPELGPDLARCLIQMLASMALLGAAALFWAVRTRSMGACMVTLGVTVALFSRWMGRAPAYDAHPARVLFGMPTDHLAWLANLAVLVAGVAVFGLYAVRRLRHPETLLD